MARDISDDIFYNAYQKDPHVKELVDDVQLKYTGHSSQKNQPNYDPTTWYGRAKKDPAIVNAVKDFIAKQSQEPGLEAKTNATHAEIKHKASSDAKTESITGLLGIITAIGAVAAGYPVIAMAAAAVTLTSLYSQYQKPYQRKPA